MLESEQADEGSVRELAVSAAMNDERRAEDIHPGKHLHPQGNNPVGTRMKKICRRYEENGKWKIERERKMKGIS